MHSDRIDRIRRAVTDEDEIAAVVDALGDTSLSLHQLAAALGIEDEDLADWMATRAERIAAPASLRAGDIVVRTQSATAPTVIRIERPYRRIVGAAGYSAEVSIRGRRRTVDAAAIAGWFPVDALRMAGDDEL